MLPDNMGAADMKIVVAVRCYNEIKNVYSFMRGYDFADEIIVSDGGSTDGSVEILENYPKVRLFHFPEQETVNGVTWNPDAPHMNFVLDIAKEYSPDWLIFDDMDCNPVTALRENARNILENCDKPQVNAFRLYMWGEERYFPLMNKHFDPMYTSLWGWKPKELDIRADEKVRHGTLVGLSDDPLRLERPNCLLHKSWHPKTIGEKMRRYNAIGLPFNHPRKFAGKPECLPEWAVE